MPLSKVAVDHIPLRAVGSKRLDGRWFPFDAGEVVEASKFKPNCLSAGASTDLYGGVVGGGFGHESI